MAPKAATLLPGFESHPRATRGCDRQNPSMPRSRASTLPQSRSITILAGAGFAALLVATSAGLAIGALPFGISTHALAVTIAMMLLFGAGAYHASRDLILVATVESLWLALFVARTMPITFEF
jgi:hypothetical protein